MLQNVGGKVMHLLFPPHLKIYIYIYIYMYMYILNSPGPTAILI